MAALQSCRFVSPAPAVLAASASVKVKPPSTLAVVPAGRRERCFPSLTLRRGQQAALRPCVAARAQKRGGAQPTSGSAEHHFVEERERVMDRYRDIIDIDHGCLYMEATAMSAQVCLSANQALKMASRVMGSAGLNLATPNEISKDTVHKTLLAYVDIFLDAADASYNRTVSKKTMMAFLGALRGLASISHILLDTALEALSHTHPRESLSEYAFNRDVEAMRHEFYQQMSNLEDDIRKASAVEICKLVMPAILEGMKITGSFVGLMVTRRRKALGKAHTEVVV